MTPVIGLLRRPHRTTDPGDRGPSLEMSRDIARAFHRWYREGILRLPEAAILPDSACSP